jgi:plastocyanin
MDDHRDRRASWGRRRADGPVRALTLAAVAVLLSGCEAVDSNLPDSAPGPEPPAAHTPLPAPNAVMTLSAQGNAMVFSPRTLTLDYGAGTRTVQWVNSDPAAPHRIQGWSSARHRVLFSTVLAAQGSGRRTSYTYHFTTPAPDTVTVTDPGSRSRSRDGSGTVVLSP